MIVGKAYNRISRAAFAAAASFRQRACTGPRNDNIGKRVEVGQFVADYFARPVVRVRTTKALPLASQVNDVAGIQQCVELGIHCIIDRPAPASSCNQNHRLASGKSGEPFAGILRSPFNDRADRIAGM